MLRVITVDNVQGVQDRYTGIFQTELAQGIQALGCDTYEYVCLWLVASKASMAWA